MASVTRKAELQTAHDKWVAAIARARFGFPNKEHPTWETRTNPGSDKNIKVRANDGTEFYPDIVVRDQAKTSDDLVMIAEVETSESVAESEVAQWRDYAKTQPFYLYMPKGNAVKAKQLAAGVKVAGFREYSVANGKNVYVEV